MKVRDLIKIVENGGCTNKPSWIERKDVRKYRVVIERGQNNLSPFVPDLPGCVTTGKTVEEVDSNIREAIELHLEGMLEDGQPIPEPSTCVPYVELQVT